MNILIIEDDTATAEFVAGAFKQVGYATMHVAAFRNAPATALNLGHGRSTEMLEEHYRGLVARSTAERYWRIVPADG